MGRLILHFSSKSKSNPICPLNFPIRIPSLAWDSLALAESFARSKRQEDERMRGWTEEREKWKGLGGTCHSESGKSRSNGFWMLLKEKLHFWASPSLTMSSFEVRYWFVVTYLVYLIVSRHSFFFFFFPSKKNFSFFFFFFYVGTAWDAPSDQMSVLLGVKRLET